MSTQPQPSVETRFAYIASLVDMVAIGGSKSLIICGDGGLGKTFAVTARLKRAGLRARTEVSQQPATMPTTAPVVAPVSTRYVSTRQFRGGSSYVYEAENASQGILASPRAVVESTRYDYAVVKGYSAPKALYRALYENRTKLVIFDDCDSVWKDLVAVSILKAALDSYDERWISWLSEAKGETLPRSFLFEGKVIFISNLPLAGLDQAMLSRSLCIDVTMTVAEKLTRIASLAPTIRPEIARQVKQEAFNLLVEVANQAGDLNLRTFLKVLEIRLTGNPDWRELARYVVTAI